MLQIQFLMIFLSVISLTAHAELDSVIERAQNKADFDKSEVKVLKDFEQKFRKLTKLDPMTHRFEDKEVVTPEFQRSVMQSLKQACGNAVMSYLTRASEVIQNQVVSFQYQLNMSIADGTSSSSRAFQSGRNSQSLNDGDVLDVSFEARISECRVTCTAAATVEFGERTFYRRRFCEATPVATRSSEYVVKRNIR